MTVLLLALTIALAPNQGPPSGQAVGTGTISGVVTSSPSNRPIPNATLRVVQWVGGLGRQFTARTDAQGKFTLKDLVAGSYEITAQADGHVTMRYGQRAPTDGPRRIELADAQQFSDANIALPKFSAIEGQLLDEFGDPMPGIVVWPASVAFAAGKTRLMPAQGAQSVMPTDDRGMFRLYGLAPGDYYLMAATGSFAGPAGPSGFAVTFYPGTTNPPDAKPVHLDIGRDTRGISFAMTPAPMSTISGAVSDADGNPARGNVMLFGLSGGDIRSFMNANIATDPDGRFTFRNLAPGSYVIQAYGRPAAGGGNLGRSPFGSLVVDVNGSRDDLRVVVRGSRMTGRILFEGTAPQPPIERVVLTLMPVEFVSSPAGGGPPAMTVNPDWTFEVLNLSGLRVARPIVGAPGWFLKSVTIAGKDFTDTPIDFRNGDVADVEVTFTSSVGTIKGTASDANGPVTDAAILAFAEDASKWTFPSRFMAAARPSPRGEFTLTGLPAGWYLVAVAPAGISPQTADPAVLENLRKTAVRVNVLDGATATVALTIIK
ncbi:MAG: carboxypeptidase regulatory-like domain-containing protein [Acidobacteria bacterium]|nr:MAG: carboxypeptidase regulatory-like domain-containing protein [Acidobacteriota bacterium]